MTARLIAYAVAFGALALLGWQWQARGERIDALLAATGTLTTQRDQCRADQQAIDQALAQLRAAGEADRIRREAVERAAAQAVADAERKVRAALTARVPTECPAAMQWLGDYGRDLATTWGAQ